MRVVGGRHRGLALASPKGAVTRPTSERTREAVFNILSHGRAAISLDGIRVLDLFAGTGALGIEALSRGARFCLFVDNDAPARGLIRRNIEAISAQGASKVWRRDATQLGPRAPMTAFRLVFIDPPYGRGLGGRALQSLRDGDWLESGAVIVLEEQVGAEIILPDAFMLIDRRVYGDTQILFIEAN